ncbi:NtaA/DmoA family FMN-dependent monooxygenase [Silvibacterium sp.]|uniref:NtaA/DmoA family FMN-dependent monooxygenase n=1 Tax=Silvibacterium sp. TaxID=1964179 RepID=UPI0039E2DB06
MSRSSTGRDSRVIHLMLAIGDAGFHQASWRLPQSRVEQISEFSLFADLARRAEAARLDALFVADVLGFAPDSLRSWPTNQLEPISLLSAISAVTRNLGLIGTVSSTFTPPYTIARQILSLDHLSGGRAGWNVVTSRGGAALFGEDTLPSHEGRYNRAEETLAAVRGLWDGWAPDTVRTNREAGEYGSPDHVKELNLQGGAIKVRGALPSPRSRQGRPLVVLAGASPSARDLAARYADILFTMQPALSDGIDFTKEIRERAVRWGRRPDEIRILQGVAPFVGATETAAHALKQTLADLTDISTAKARVSSIFGGVSLDALPLDEPIAPHLDERARASVSSAAAVALLKLADSGATLNELLQALVTSRGHWIPVGSYSSVADAFEERVALGACDGFVVFPPDLGLALDGFLDGLVPMLRERGFVRKEYQGATLRANLNLDKPTWQPFQEGVL